MSAIRNREMPAFGRVLKYYINSPSVGTASNVRYLEESAIGRCPLREVPLYIVCSVNDISLHYTEQNHDIIEVALAKILSTPIILNAFV